MKRFIWLSLAVFTLSCSSFALTATYGWEDGNTVLGTFGSVTGTSSMSPVNTGSYSLELNDTSVSSTPQAYVAWIKGLQNGDVVTASFWNYDTTPTSSPSARIWGHWNDSATDVNGYNGSAGGNNTYGAGNGWDQLSYSWTVADGHTGLIVEARTYNVDGQTCLLWIDDLTVTTSNRAGISITTPGGTTVPEPGTIAAIGFGIATLIGLRRKK